MAHRDWLSSEVQPRREQRSARKSDGVVKVIRSVQYMVIWIPLLPKEIIFHNQLVLTSM